MSDNTLTELTLLGLAFLLSATVGLERHRNFKSAGLRTHTLVGVGSAVFTLVSAYGFQAVTEASTVVDPSRIAAQIVSGIGFLGAGVIFIRHNSVAGLTTAASIWVSASIGMACGAGLPVLAAAATALHHLAVWALGKLGARIRPPLTPSVVNIRYREGQGSLTALVALAESAGFEMQISESRQLTKPGKSTKVQAVATLSGPANLNPASLLSTIAEAPGVVSISVMKRDTDVT